MTGAIACALACGVWVIAGWRLARNAAPLRRLREQTPPDPPAWPPLSVLVPACNEAATLEPAMASLLAQDYPGLEIILIDDRSTDGTGAVVDRLAARDPRVVPLHVTSLPDGWLGKVHALARARGRATGEWLLFTDADVHFARGALRRAIAFALADGAGHLALLPEIPVRGFWLRTAIGAFSHALFLVLDGHRMGEPRSGVMMGIGAFNLVRAADLDASPGLEWLRLEVIDDVGLAQMLNRNGVRGALLGGHDVIAVAWYPTLGAMVRGLEKGAFAAMRYRIGAVVGAAVFTMAALAGLLTAPWFMPAPWGLLLALAAWGAYTAGGMAANARMDVPRWLACSAPAGTVINTWILVRSTLATLWRGGVVWRGTRYPLAALRSGKRVVFQ